MKLLYFLLASALKIVILKTFNNNKFDERMNLFNTAYRISQINSIKKSFTLFCLITLQIQFTKYTQNFTVIALSLFLYTFAKYSSRENYWYWTKNTMYRVIEK